MNIEPLTAEDMKGSIALRHAAQNVISFERTKVTIKEDDFVMYRCSTDENGEPQCVEVARGVCSSPIDWDVEEPAPRVFNPRVSITIDFPIF